MKTICKGTALLVMICFLGIGCIQETHQLTENNKAILSRFMEEVWNKGNLDAADEFVASSYVIHRDPGDSWEGQTLDLPTFKKRVAYSRQIFPDLHFAVQEIIGEGDRVAINWYLQGTHKGNIPGFPATGKRVKVPGLTVYYFSQGKITGHWQVIDRLGFMQQVGPSARSNSST